MSVTPTTVVLIGGTWGGDYWTNLDSSFCWFLRSQGFAPKSFQWSGDIDGVCDPFENGRFSDWKAGGYSLSYLLQNLPYDERNVIAHSHGGQIPAFATTLTQLRLRNLVTVCTPVRKDLHDVYLESQQYINRWRHVLAKGWDFWQRAGEFMDGRVGWSRKMPLHPPHDNVSIKGIEHHLLLTEPTLFEHWTNDGLLDVLRTPAKAVQGV